MSIGQGALVRGQARGPDAGVVTAAPAPRPRVLADVPAPGRTAVARGRGGKAVAASPRTPVPFGGVRPSAAAAPPAAPAPPPAVPAAAPARSPPPAPPAEAPPAPPPAAAPAADEPGEAVAQIDAESVRQVVRMHQGDLRACYQQGLKQQPDARGTVEIQFAINAEGRAVRSRPVKDTLALPGVPDCIIGWLERWRFPRPVGGEVEFIYPFTFSPGR